MQKATAFDSGKTDALEVQPSLRLLGDPRLAGRRYSVIYADPPWRYRSKNRGRGGAEDHYPTMAVEEIKAVRLPAAQDCALFLWATMPLLPDALAVIKAWGFTYRTVAFCWVKQNMSGPGLFTGLGAWTRANSELCLLATRGRPHRLSRRVHSVVISPRQRHSQKPDEVRRRIVDLMGDVPRLEMFARTQARGWDVWGDEAVPLALHPQSPKLMKPVTHRSRACGTDSSALRGKDMPSRTPYTQRLHTQHRVALQGLGTTATVQEEGST